MSPSTDHKAVLMMPDYRRDNPYQSLLAAALHKQRVQVSFPSGYRRVFPFTREVRSRRPEVLHLHWLSPYLRGSQAAVQIVYYFKLLLDLYLVRASGTRIIWTVHNLISHESRHPRLEWWLRQRIASLATRVIVHSEAAAEEVAAYGLATEKIAVIPHGHFRGHYGPVIDTGAAKDKIGVRPRGLLFVHAGMLRPYKGIEELLAAWHRHTVTHKHDVLLIAGQTSETYGQQVDALCKKTRQVIYRPGFMTDRQLCATFSAADVVVLPFRKILTSGSLLLAMSFRRPVVAPQIPMTLELLKGADDLLYEGQSDNALEAALNRAHHVDLMDLAIRTENACDRLDWDPIARETASVYGFRTVLHAADRPARSRKEVEA